MEALPLASFENAAALDCSLLSAAFCFTVSTATYAHALACLICVLYQDGRLAQCVHFVGSDNAENCKPSVRLKYVTTVHTNCEFASTKSKEHLYGCSATHHKSASSH
jgi:hypothetical protein